MALSKEFTIYCLSTKKGWVNTVVKYDFGEQQNIREKPDDTVLEVRFVTEIPYPNKVYKTEYVINGNDSDKAVKQAKRQYGERPKNPYI